MQSGSSVVVALMRPADIDGSRVEVVVRGNGVVGVRSGGSR